MRSKRRAWISARFRAKTGRQGGKPQPLPNLVGKWNFAAQTYHGGRNEALKVGFSPEGREIYDLDLMSAYTTALAMIRQPDWSTARYTTDIAELATVDGAMTFAHVKFRFPRRRAFHHCQCAPATREDWSIRLQGWSWCTGPEMVVALAQGATIEVEEGLRIDWVRELSAGVRSVHAQDQRHSRGREGQRRPVLGQDGERDRQFGIRKSRSGRRRTKDDRRRHPSAAGLQSEVREDAGPRRERYHPANDGRLHDRARARGRL